MPGKNSLILSIFLLLVMTACSTPYAVVDSLSAKELSVEQARALAGGLSPLAQGLEDWKAMAFTLDQSLSYLESRPEGESLALPGKTGLRLTRATMRAGLLRLREILPYLDINPGLLAEEFIWLRLDPNFGFSGYYEPTILADYQEGPVYGHPLYALPPDLQAGTQYHDRRRIDREKVLSGQGLELAWIRDEVDAFYLQIQGSGRLIFPDGRVKHVLYAGKNGHPYVSLGRVLRELGHMKPEEISMPGIRAFLREHPELREELLDSNPSYVFFRLEDEGPVGGMNRLLTPWVSLATDQALLPYGSLVFFQVRLPDRNGAHTGEIQALGLPQDRGGAIRGRRIDWFTGAGREAEHLAGYLNSPGEIYLLLPHPDGSFTSSAGD
ncbi:MAG: MltA domain-containing protein [Desulfovibrionaceae bacterium]|nr:MltA domain-containing protein [Desulfovibrionaceae bacterium]